MKSTLIHGSIVVKKSSVHGYGVFATKDFAREEIVEECYALVFAEEIEPLVNYIYDIENKTGVVLGNAMIYNHSDYPNIRHDYDAEKSALVFTALRKIKKGEELLHSYGKDWFSLRKTQPKPPSFYFKLRHKYSFFMFMFRFGLIAGTIAALCKYA